MTGIQGRIEIDHQIEFAEGLASKLRVGIRAVEVAAQTKTIFQGASPGSFHAAKCVETRLGWEFQSEFGLKAIKNDLFEFWSHAHGTDALDI